MEKACHCTSGYARLCAGLQLSRPTLKLPHPLARGAGERLVTTHEEPQCLQCGYVDYRHEVPAPAVSDGGLLSSATRMVIRYVGDSPSLIETLLHVDAKRAGNRVAYQVTCPFCSQLMTEMSLSGKRREVRERRYVCGVGHRVSLTPVGQAKLGWK